MSHFVVLVIGEDVDAALAPYQENNMGDCPKEYLEFNDVSDEVHEKWNSGTTEWIVDAQGNKFSPFDERFRNPNYSFFKAGGEDNPQFVFPEGFEMKENMPFKEIYPDEETFAKEWFGYKLDPEKQAYGYWENPNRKWDWWTYGGRYCNRLTTKAGQKVDQARVGELDLEAMKAARLADRTAWWAEYEKKAAEEPQNLAMIQYLHGIKPGMTREEYLAEAEEPLSVFAVVKDGKWYERGEMGWFAVVTGEKEPGAWKNEVKQLLADLPADALLTIVDCHI